MLIELSVPPERIFQGPSHNDNKKGRGIYPSFIIVIKEMTTVKVHSVRGLIKYCSVNLILINATNRIPCPFHQGVVDVGNTETHTCLALLSI